jgi:hypothetical protein
MRTTFFKLFYLWIAGILILSACNLPGSNIAPQITSRAETPTANVTATKLTATPTEAVPTDTPSVTPTETPVPEPSATLTPEPIVAEVVRESNCRTGPAGNYDLVATYQPGQRLEVIAKDLGAGYWFVQNPEKPEEQCYLLAQNIRITGDTSVLPQFTPRASPTAAPYFNVTFRKLDTCEGYNYALFVVENAGSIPFRSVYIKVTDPKVGRSVEQVLSAFDLRRGCVLAKNIAPLDPGGTGYVASPQFKWSVTGHKLNAIIMLCTEKALKGTCITKTVEVKA